MQSETLKKKLRVWVGVFVATALVLSIAQNIHYFLKYTTSLDTILVCTTKGHSLSDTKSQLEGALEVEEGLEKRHNSTAEKVLQDLIVQAKKHGLAKDVLIMDLKDKFD
ncbi:hypothetical protein [Helicobacter salomonis]|uniref:hypothetical protein n=1 Tax=Helicobacter salomonis TaxID=56878 RepID=UPI000CF01EAC|nr:hypothetical protein [Helicobacter salomonis]